MCSAQFIRAHTAAASSKAGRLATWLLVLAKGGEATSHPSVSFFAFTWGSGKCWAMHP